MLVQFHEPQRLDDLQPLTLLKKTRSKIDFFDTNTRFYAPILKPGVHLELKTEIYADNKVYAALFENAVKIWSFFFIHTKPGLYLLQDFQIPRFLVLQHVGVPGHPETNFREIFL